MTNHKPMLRIGDEWGESKFGMHRKTLYMCQIDIPIIMNDFLLEIPALSSDFFDTFEEVVFFNVIGWSPTHYNNKPVQECSLQLYIDTNNKDRMEVFTSYFQGYIDAWMTKTQQK